MEKTVRYREADVIRALNLLNGLDVKGVENMERLLQAFSIIQNPLPKEEEKEEEDGTE